jgi:hypothetical protein
LDEKIAEYFAAVIKTAADIFENCAHETDFTPERAILHLHGEYDSCKILITELFSDKVRKYRYYVYKETGLKQALTMCLIHGLYE